MLRTFCTQVIFLNLEVGSMKKVIFLVMFFLSFFTIPLTAMAVAGVSASIVSFDTATLTQNDTTNTEVISSATVRAAFSDDDGDPLTYSLATSTNPFTISSTNGRITLTRPLVQTDVNNSPLTGQVVATDETGAVDDPTRASTVSFVVIVQNVNDPPVASPTAVIASSRTQNNSTGTLVRGSTRVQSYFTDADGDTLTYSLAVINDFTISSTNGQITLARTLVQADVNNSPLTVDVVASDDDSGMAVLTLTVPVLNVNDSPVASPTAVTASSRTQNNSTGTLVRDSTRVQSYFTDIDGDTLTYSLATTNDFTINSTNGQVTLARTLVQTDVNNSTLTVEVVASDGSLTATTTLTVPVLNVNDAPVASPTAVTASSLTQNNSTDTLVRGSTRVQSYFTDIDGDTLTYSLATSTSAFTISSTNGRVTLMRTLVQADVNNSPLTVGVVASDGSLTATTTLTVPILNVNDAPVASPTAVTASSRTQNNSTGTLVRGSTLVQSYFTDIDGDTLMYSLATSTSAFTISSTNGRVTLMRTLVQADVDRSPLTVDVIASDGSLTATTTLTVPVLNVNDAPVAISTAVTASTRIQNDSTDTVVSGLAEVQGYFIDDDIDTLTYSLANQSTNAFMIISSTNGQITLARTLVQTDVSSSPLTVDIIASDGSLTATTTLTVPILNVNDAPVASPTAVTASSRTENEVAGTVVRGSTRVQSYFTDIDGDTLTYSLANQSTNAFMIISSTNGQITLARTLVQADVNNSTLTVEVVASDGSLTATTTLTVPVLNVDNAPVASPTAVTASSLTQNNSTGTLVRGSTQVQSYFTDADGDTLTYTLANQSTEAFMISTNGRITLMRTLVQADVSSSPLTVDVVASDGSLAATTTLTVPVLNVNDAPVANPIAVTASSRTENEMEGTVVRGSTRVQSYFTDIDGDTLTYTLANPSTDAFIISSTNGRITLMRTLVQADVNNSTLTVEVVASDGSLTATTTLTVPVLNVDNAPVSSPTAVTASSLTQNNSTGTLVRGSTQVQSYFTDADGDTLTYTLANQSTEAFMISTNGRVTLMRTLVQADVSSSPLTVDVVASDGSLAATTTLTVPVLNVNDAPVANPIAVTASSRTENEVEGTVVRGSTRVQSYFTDIDGDTLTYTLANPSTNAFIISSTNGRITLMRTLVQADVNNSTLTVEVVASDGSLTATTTLTVPVLNVDNAPVASPTAVTASSRTQNNSTGTLVRGSTQVISYFTDADGDTLTYTLANQSTEAFMISTNGRVTLMRTLVQADVSSSPLTVDVVASDGSLAATTTLTVPVLNVNDAPVANPIAVTASSRTENEVEGTVVRGSTRVQSYFTDIDGDTLTYTLANPSTNAFIISSTNGRITLMRTLVQADVNNSTLTVEVVASDGSLTATTTLTVPVLNVDNAPVASPTAVTASSRTQNNSTGTLVRGSTQVISYFTDADGDTLTYTLANQSTEAFMISTNGRVTLMRTLVQADVSSSPLTVDVVASDGSLAATTTLTVPVLNVNDAPVASPTAVTASSRTQNNSTGTLVRGSTRVQSYFTDIDGDTLTYTLANQSTEAFMISTNGRITLMRTLVQADVSSSPLTVEVIASDGSLTATTTLTVPVLNVNEAPVASPTAVTASSRTQNNSTGTLVRGSTRVQSYFTDIDGDTLTYSLATTNDFTINSTNGQVTLARTLVQADVNNSTLTVEVVASDGSLTATTTLTVPVLNVNDAPVASPTAVTASSRTQNNSTDTLVRGSTQVQSYFTDIDGDTLTYSLATSTSAFTISSTNGRVTLMRTLVQADVNNSPLTVGVVASDGSLTATTTLTVPVLNVNDAPVASPTAVTASSRTQNNSTGTLVRGSTLVQSYFTDIDGDTLTYSLATSTSAFTISSTNGQITLMRTLVQADVSSSPLTVDVIASDGSLTATTTLTVPVLNVNDAPVASPTAVTASSRTQNEMADTVVRGSTRVQSYFTDIDGDTLTYSLATSTSAFTISSTNGRVTLMRTLVQADVDSSPLTVGVVASDGSLTATTTLTVPILNVNDAPVASPTAVTASSRTQNEMAGTVVRGSTLVQSYFTDADGDTLTYTLANQSTEAFMISTNGRITLMRTLVQADVSSSPLTVDVVASDGSLAATTTLTVPVLDVNVAPVASPTAVTASSRTQNEMAGTLVRGSTQVISYFNDVDGDTLTYSLATTNDFTINSTNGQVTLARTLVQADVNNSPLTVGVVASDGSLTATTTLTVPVLNVNDAPVANPTAITASSRTENEVAGTVVRGSTRVQSYFTDADGDTLTYSLSTSTNDFTISSTNGQVTLARTLVQADVNNSPLTVDVVASDGSLTATTTLTVPVLNVNDAPVANDDVIDQSVSVTFSTLNVDVLANDTDVDGDTLSVASVANASNLGIYTNSSSMVLFTASDALFRRSGTVYSTAVYTITDSQLTSTALVTIRFAIPNDLDGDGIGNVLDLNPTTSSGSITLIGTATISSHQFLALQTIGLTTASLVSDSDGDTWPDVVELLLNTSITSVISSDVDADGIPDEVEMYLSSQTSSVTITAVSDRDNDGFYDIQELRLATDPFSAASIPVHSTTTADTDRDGILDTEEVFIGLSSGTYTTQTALAVTNTLAFSDVNGTAQSVNTNVAITINASPLSRVILTSSTFVWDISGAGIASTPVQTTSTMLVVTPLSNAALTVTLTIDEPITRNNLRIPLLHVSTGTVVATIATPPASSGGGGCSLNTNANTDGILWLLSLFALFMILRSRRRA